MNWICGIQNVKRKVLVEKEFLECENFENEK